MNLEERRTTRKRKNEENTKTSKNKNSSTNTFEFAIVETFSSILRKYSRVFSEDLRNRSPKLSRRSDSAEITPRDRLQSARCPLGDETVQDEDLSASF